MTKTIWPNITANHIAHRDHQVRRSAMAYAIALAVASAGLIATAPAHAMNQTTDQRQATSHTSAGAPKRVVDTRSNVGHQGKIAAGDTVDFSVCGGPGVSWWGRQSVALNITVVDAEEAGSLTVTIPGQERPSTAHVSFGAGNPTSNHVVVEKSFFGNVSLHVSATAHVIVDVVHGFDRSGDVVSVPPHTLLDTRTDESTGRVPGNNRVSVAPADHFGFTDGKRRMWLLNITVHNPEHDGFVAAFPDEETGEDPREGNIYFKAGQSVSATVFSTGGMHNMVDVFSSATTDVVVDVIGYVADNQTIVPARATGMFDTRMGHGDVRPPGDTLTVPTAEFSEATEPVAAVVVNVMATDTQADGHVTVRNGDYPRHGKPMMRYVAGQTVANTMVVPVDAAGNFTIHTSAGAHLYVDLLGYIPK